VTAQGGSDKDRRTAARHKVIKGAEVVFNNRNSVVSGLVWNHSDDGAKFVVSSPSSLPREVSLRLPTGAERKAEVNWQKGGLQFGLKFIDTIKS
jgi:hypothetical protein